MRTERMAMPVAAALLLALAGGAALAQQAPQGQTPQGQTPQGQTLPGTDAGPQRPNPTAIPEKFGPPIDAKKPSTPEERTGQGNIGAQPPHNRGLDLQAPTPDPKTLSEPPARPPQSQ
jgi:hypothetical protein